MPPGLVAEATLILLLFARVGSMIMLMPMLGGDSVPRQIRLLLALGLTVSLSGILKPSVAPLLGASEIQLASLLLTETVTGLALGLEPALFIQEGAAVVICGLPPVPDVGGRCLEAAAGELVSDDGASLVAPLFGGVGAIGPGRLPQ